MNSSIDDEKIEDENSADDPIQILKVAEEKLSLEKENVVDRTITVKRLTENYEQLVDLTLCQQKVKIEHIAINLQVDRVPDIREEDGVIIIPVVEEEIEIVRKLVLREEVHIRREELKSEEKHSVSLRRQHIQINDDDKDH